MKNIAELNTLIGYEFSPSTWIEVTQQMINNFADATHDQQWIHIDEERAKTQSPFGKTIAHGFMSVALLSKMVEGFFVIESVKMGLNYGLNKVRFPSPVVVGSKLRLLATLKDVEASSPNRVKLTLSCIVEIEGVEKPACVAEWLFMFFE